MPGPSMFSVLRERLLLRQFIVSDFAVKQAEFLRNVGEWMPSSTDWKRRPGRSWREGKNFGETLVKAATQGTDGLGFCGDLQQAVNRAAEVRDELAPLACCVRAATGHAAAAPPSSVMKSRRFIAVWPPCLRRKR
jgi:hypothetical protein